MGLFDMEFGGITSKNAGLYGNDRYTGSSGTAGQNAYANGNSFQDSYSMDNGGYGGYDNIFNQQEGFGQDGYLGENGTNVSSLYGAGLYGSSNNGVSPEIDVMPTSQNQQQQQGSQMSAYDKYYQDKNSREQRYSSQMNNRANEVDYSKGIYNVGMLTKMYGDISNARTQSKLAKNEISYRDKLLAMQTADWEDKNKAKAATQTNVDDAFAKSALANPSNYYTA